MDDFFRIPKSLCYFMMRHPPLQERLGDQEKRKIEREARKRRDHQPSIVTKKSPSSTGEDLSRDADEPIAEETSPRRRRASNRRVAEEASGGSPSGQPTAISRVKVEHVSEQENAIELEDIPLDIRKAELSPADAKAPTTAKKKRLKKRTKTTLECETCSLSFSQKGQYRRHMIKHSTVRLHKCDVCEKAFKRKSELKNHMQLHSGLKFTCDECNFVTTNKVSVRTHVRRVHQRDFRYKCDECDKSFMSNCEMKDHRTSHLGTKSFICEICGKAYLQKSYLVAHKRTVHGVVQKSLVKEHHCDVCNKSFASEYILRNHAGVHSRKFLCTHCGKEFATNHGLQLHCRLHTGERPFECKHCSKTFTRPNTLRLHNLTHTGERPYVCDLCGQSFTQRSSMMGHRKKHPGSHPPPPPTLLSRSETKNDLTAVRIVKSECPTVDSHLGLTAKVAKVERCSEDEYEIDIYADPLEVLKSEWRIVESSSSPPRSFCDPIERKNEASESNSDERRTRRKNVSLSAYLECPICQMKFRGTKGLKGHRMRMHAAEQPKFECDICGNRYQLKSGIASHMRRNHLNQRGCRYCGKRVIGLERHERRHRAQLDDTAVTYSCTICGNKFRNECNLANHMLTHKRQCTWACDLCGLVTASSRKLARHKHSAHQPVKKFPCPVCQKLFTMSNFYQHVLMHSSVRPFECEFCGSTFVQRSTFVRHRKQRHTGPLPPIKPVPIADLAKEFLRSISKTM